MSTFRKSINLASDILLLYISLAATLLIRYKISEFAAVFKTHFQPFTFIFIVWITVFYINDLYRDKFLSANYNTIQRFTFNIFINVAVSIILFYLFPLFFRLTPKTNLFIFAAIFGISDLAWKFILAKIYITSGLRNRLLIVGDSAVTNEIINYIKNNPQLGYDIIGQIKEFSEIKDINQISTKGNINTVIIQPHFKKDPVTAKIIYKLLTSNISVIDSITFYEIIFQKLAFEELEEGWFIEKITPRKPVYETAKRILDFALSLTLIVILSPLMILIAILIKLTSKGPFIYKQERIGLKNKPFMLYKFRTMVAGHHGPHWTTENDSRVTGFGKILRYSHLDETMQLFNILKNDISFTGPRAESKELVEIYKQLPYYDLRHIIKPGLTGWAQVNYKASASVEEAKEKLKYDIYYIKNRSLTIDFLILLKTIKYLFANYNV